jgi:hypothetical protein
MSDSTAPQPIAHSASMLRRDGLDAELAKPRPQLTARNVGSGVEQHINHLCGGPAVQEIGPDAQDLRFAVVDNSSPEGISHLGNPLLQIQSNPEIVVGLAACE